MRTIQHIVDTQTIKKALRCFPDHWVVRELSERDYGIDLMVEIFSKNTNDVNDPFYESTGWVLNVQLKGTSKAIRVLQTGTVNYSFEKSTLRYIERFAIPFILMRVDVSSSEAKSYFVWIQRYIKEVLDVEDPTWRDTKSKTVTIRIPSRNVFPGCIEKLERIASRVKYIEELVDYREIHADIEQMFTLLKKKRRKLDEAHIRYLAAQLAKMKRLPTLMSQNQSCVDAGSIDKFLSQIEAVKEKKKRLGSVLNSAEKFNLDLLASNIEFLNGLENAVAENDGETAY